jgi:hypothetical protein
MTWRKTLGFWLLFAILAGFYVLFERQPTAPAEAEVKREKLLPAFSDEITVFTLRHDGREVRCEKRDKRWLAVQPKGVFVPHDLVTALVETLTEKQEAEVMEGAPTREQLASFGLEQPASVFELESADGKKLRVSVGIRNPPRTAIYVQTSLSPRVMLAGLNVDYYGDLIYDAAYPGTKKK